MKNIVHAALALVIVLAGVAAQFLLLQAEFIGIVQVLIYIGAVVVLFLFGIMLTRAPMRKTGEFDNDQRILAGLVALLIFGVLASSLLQPVQRRRPPPRPADPDDRDRRLDLPDLRRRLRGRRPCCCSPPSSAPSSWREGTERQCPSPQYLLLSAFLFCTGIYGVLARRNGVLVLMSIELMLNAVNINLVAFSARLSDAAGQVFALFVIAIAAAEVGVGLAIILLIYRNRVAVNLDEIDLMKG